MTGDDPEDLQATADRVETTLSTTPGLVEVSSDLTDQRPLRVVDKRQGRGLGFTQAEVGQAIANALRGTKVGTVVLEGESRDIMVKPQEADEASPEQIAALSSRSANSSSSRPWTEPPTGWRTSRTRYERGERLSEEGDALADRQEDRRPAGEAAEEQQDRGRGGRRPTGRLAAVAERGPGQPRRQPRLRVLLESPPDYGPPRHQG